MLVMRAVLITVILVSVMNLIADICQAALDPRIRLILIPVVGRRLISAAQDNPLPACP